VYACRWSLHLPKTDATGLDFLTSELSPGCNEKRSKEIDITLHDCRNKGLKLFDREEMLKK